MATMLGRRAASNQDGSSFHPGSRTDNEELSLSLSLSVPLAIEIANRALMTT
jgi:hypothetical protein